ncbi:GNAT family N-acetyltransferase [Bradyrhizobium brasilense]|uniref:GNAT family N-acetyltransferase n=1 Tax=Bradyrhizobium brasilense TaxID=1419277 RepID=UPI001E334194|nr:GNAT family N-acetyltransferase [Bradyrhizobium brasilense]MCC8971586.1 GNAT family N-acetyltransferase [Bradyrhizobium brasilense]
MKKARLLTLRPAGQSDRDFAWETWADAVKPHIMPVILEKFQRDWNDDEEMGRFTEWWQPSASTIIVLGDLPVGWLATEEKSDEINLVNFVISKKYRRHGIASIVLGAKLNEWSSKFKTVTHSVLKSSGYASFFEHRGFRLKTEEDFLLTMEASL